MTDIILTGVGGQGIVFASKVIGETARRQGRHVRTAETIGMAQRGGSVVSHVRLDDAVLSPLVPQGHADLLIAFEPAEAFRCLGFLAPDGCAIVNSHPVASPLSEALGVAYDPRAVLADLEKQRYATIFIDGWQACRSLANAKVLNVVLLGAALRDNRLGMSLEDVTATITARAPRRFLEANLAALKLGYQGELA